MKSVVRHSVSVDLRDEPIFPTRGAYVQFSSEVCGLGGGVAHLKNELKAQHNLSLTEHIFLHNVVLVRREDNVWKVKHKHVKTGDIFEEEYDYVVVGNGYFSKPNMPDTPGQDVFKERRSAPNVNNISAPRDRSAEVWLSFS